MPTPEVQKEPTISKPPETDRSPESHIQGARSGVQDTLIDNEKPRISEELIGKEVVYSGGLVPCKEGEGTLKLVRIGGAISIEINIITKSEESEESTKGIAMRGFIAIDSEGKVVGSNGILGFVSNTGLNYYFRHAFKDREQELADHLINQLKN